MLPLSCREISKAFLQEAHIETSDGKESDAAMRTAGATGDLT